MDQPTPSIDEIFFAAMERESAEARAAYLNEVCGPDLDLRRRVERLLDAQPKMGSFLDSPAAGPTMNFVPAEALEGPGTVIGPYKLLEQIGEGGMGIVYMAEQTQPVRRKVALKIIKPGMDTRQVVARFEAERQALAMMDHPNIAKVLDAGATKSGRPYFVMELVRGVPITEYCDQQRLPIHNRLDLFTQVCQAVQHAHLKGIIHRDVKPTNVLVTTLDGVPLPRVIDFGIAKATGQCLTDKTLFTGFAQLIGTPLYMSPEQAELSAADIDTRSDIYSLGVLLYELLTGTTPFDQDTFRTAALDEVRRIIREDEPPKPSTRLSGLGATLMTVSENRQTDARVLSRSLRGELDWIVMKALEKDRRRRYETASGLARDVERYMAGDPVEAGPPLGWYRLRKFVRRNRVVLTATFLIALALVAGTTLSVWQAIVARKARADATSQRDRARKAEADAIAQRDEARQAVDDMYTEVAEQWLEQHAALEPTQQKFLQKALSYYQRFAGETSTDPSVRLKTAKAFGRVAFIQENLGAHPAAEVAYRREQAMLEQLTADAPLMPEYRSELADIQCMLGGLLKDLGRHAEGEHLLRRSIALAEKLATELPSVPRHQSILANSHDNLGQLLQSTGRFAEAEEAYRRCIALEEKLAADSPSVPGYRSRLMASYVDLSGVLGELGRGSDAEQVVRRAIALAETLAADAPSVPDYRDSLAKAHANLGVLLTMAAKHLEAAQALRRASVLQEKLAADSPSVSDYRSGLAITQFDLGGVLEKTGHFAEAEQACRRSIALLEKLASDEPSVPRYLLLLAAGQSNLGGVLDKVGRHAEAEEYVRRAIALLEKLATDSPSVPEYRNDLAKAQSDLAGILDRRGDHAEAEKACHHAIALAQTLVTDSPAVAEYQIVLARSHLTLATIMEQTARRAESRQVYQKAIAMAEKLENPEAQNELAWSVAASPDHDPGVFQLVLHLAKKVVEQDSKSGDHWRTLGVAHSRVGDWKAAIEALEKSMQLGAGGNPVDWFFLAMAYRRTGNNDKAQSWFDKAVNQMEKDKSQNEELRRFRGEAASPLGVTEPPKPNGKKEEK